MNEKVRKAIARAIELCTKCGDRYMCVECSTESPINHDPGCPMGTLEAHLASLDEPKGEAKATPLFVAVDEDGDFGYGPSRMEALCDLAPCEEDAWHVLKFNLHIPPPSRSEPKTIQGTVTKAEE